MTLHPPHSRSRLRVAFLLADQFTLSAFANFVDVLRLAADDADKSRRILCDWSVLAEGMDPVTSSCGVRVQPDTPLRRAGAFDYLVVVGGLISDRAAFGASALSFMQQAAARGVPLVGLCTGVFTLQAAGLLQGYRCCVSWFHHQDFLDRFDSETPVSDQIFVVDRDRLTCSGGHGTSHLAAFLVQRHVGQSAATKSLNIMMIEDALGGQRAQPGQMLARQARDEMVKRAVLKMQQNIEAPLSIEEIASGLNTARRTLERRFQADLGQSPRRIYLEIRLDRAAARLRRSDQSVTDIALACGFCDAPHLTRALKAERGMTPGDIRGGILDNNEPRVSITGP